MPLTPKDWKDAPPGYVDGVTPVPPDATPLDAAGQEDQEVRLAAYADALSVVDRARANHTGTQAPSSIVGTAVVTADSRLSDARAPTAHGHPQSDVTGLSATLATSSADLAVLREAAVDVTFPEYNASRDQGVDAKAAIQAAIDHAATAARGEVLIPHGGYILNSGLVIPSGVSITAPGFGSGHSASLYHNFNGDLLTLQGGADLRNLYLEQNGAFTGAALKHVTPTATSVGFFRFERVVITDAVANRGWQRDVVIDGTAGSLGVRSIFFDKCQFFGASTPGETVVLTKPVHCFMSDCEIIQAPQSTVVCGLKVLNSFSEDVYFSGCSIDGDILSEAAGSLVFNGRVRQGRTITCAAGSANNVFSGDVERATFVNNGASSNRVGITVKRLVRVAKTAAQSTASSALPVLTWDAEGFDTDAMHDIVTNNSRLVCNRAGKYRVFATVVFAANATGARAVALRKNGASYVGGASQAPNPNAGLATSVSASTTVELAAGDYMECQSDQGSGGALDVLVSDPSLGIPTHFGMEHVG